jgi:hypothetical protein
MIFLIVAGAPKDVCKSRVLKGSLQFKGLPVNRQGAVVFKEDVFPSCRIFTKNIRI